MKRSAGILGLLLLAACSKDKPNPAPAPSSSAAPLAAADAGAKYAELSRADFNRVAAELALPLFWTEDRNDNKTLDADELVVYWGLDPAAKLADYVQAGKPTAKLDEAYARIVAGAKKKDSDARIAAVKKELAQGRVTLVQTDLTKADATEQHFAAAMLKVSSMIEALYAKQMGTTALVAKIPADDPASKTLFFRNQGPKCRAPATKDDAQCGALLAADMPKTKTSGLYPQDMLASPTFCADLQKSKVDKVLDPFTVVGGTAAALVAQPYPQAYAADMAAIAQELTKAAEPLAGVHQPLKDYVLATAKAFGDNQWWPADEAWAKMGTSSKYFLRVAPDEVYDEPCSTKALFHVTFGLINQGSVQWQQKLDPLKGDMEKALADLAGPPYAARKVSFKLPDFVDIAINAGDSRKPSGATIGQSLPNFGPVANEGRGRTIAMTNFYNDKDSLETAESLANALFCKSAMVKWTNDPAPQLMTTVLHEAAHNLGPAHQYKANGKIDREAFGGPLASTLEELKAQTSAMFFTDWLREKTKITNDEGDRAHVRDMFWAFGHVSRGMYDEDKHPMNYSQLAAIELGSYMKDGGVSWNAEESAANGKDKGCFAIDFVKLPVAIKSLLGTVAQIKAKGDKAGAEVLLKEYVDVTGEKKKLHDVITERMTRAPKASFVYDVKLAQ